MHRGSSANASLLPMQNRTFGIQFERECHNFCVNANSAVPLVYGKNIMGADCLSGSQMVQKEIGAFYYIIRPDGHCVLQFMPLNENCRVRGASGNNLEEGTEIYDADVKIVIDRIE